MKLLWSAFLLLPLSAAWPVYADEPGTLPEPLTRNVPMQEFQNRQEDVKPYNYDAPPEGLFYWIKLAEGFEEELGIRQTHEIVPVKETNAFRPDQPVFVVFKVYPHFESYQVIGRTYAEQVEGTDPSALLSEDKMYLALEDESGYLKFFPPRGGWKPGHYKVEVHVGWKVTEFSLMGTMRFRVSDGQEPTVSRSQ